jgi:general stress protein 26
MESTGFTVQTTDFDDIAAEFHERVSRVVWCNVATVDAQGRPRSRLMHPIWEGRIGWIGTWLTSVNANHQAPSLKVKQLQRNPYVSLAYIAEGMKPVYVDCRAEVVDDPDGKRRFSEFARSTPPPYGYDPAETFGGPDDPRFGVIRLVPSRIALVDFPAPPGKVVVWRA